METGVLGHSKQVEGYEHGLFTTAEIASSQKVEYRPTTTQGNVEFDIKPLPGKIYDVKSMTLFGKMGIRKKGANDTWTKPTQAEIKRKFYELAKKHHPDAANSKPSDEEKFKQITDAYDVLSNKDIKQEYDAARSGARQ